MADAVAREARANEAAATAVDAIVELLQDVAAAHPTGTGPAFGPPVRVLTSRSGSMVVSVPGGELAVREGQG